MTKKILVTGANGFVGKHVCLTLEKAGHVVFKYDINNTEEELINFINESDYIVHLAGVNRPLSVEEFYDGNSNFTKKVVDLVKNSGKNTPIIYSSSIQAELDNDYGKSKKMAENYLFECGLPVNVFRLANVFGKWCRPNYNSACATFCYNIAHGLDIQIRDPNYVIHFNYVTDIANEFLKVIEEGSSSKEILSISPIHDCSLGKLADLLYYFKKEIESDRHLPIIHDDFELKLFKTFCDYLNKEGTFLNFAADQRGSFEELYKSEKWGQISENISFPNIEKGGHYHTYKKEIFYVVDGKCQIKQRNIKNDDVLDVMVEGKDEKIVEIIPFYTHMIKNIGESNSHTIMWISEVYNEKTADTFREPVEKE